jgi:hypothetical protein
MNTQSNNGQSLGNKPAPVFGEGRRFSQGAIHTLKNVLFPPSAGGEQMPALASEQPGKVSGSTNTASIIEALSEQEKLELTKRLL